VIPLPAPSSAGFARGFAWPASGGASPDLIGDPFGHRTFTGHSSGTDFHRGTDHYDDSPGSTGKSPIHGAIVRLNFTHFQYDDAENAEAAEEVDPNNKATFTIIPGSSVLRIVGKNDGTATFLSGCARYRTKQRFTMYTLGGALGDWIVDAQIPSGLALSGKVGIAIYDPLNDEYVALQYNGSTLTVRGKDLNGVMTANGTTASVANVRWLRMKYSLTTNQVHWQYSTNASGTAASFVDIATEGTINWTHKGAGFDCFPFWDPAAAGGDDTIDIDYFGWWDAQGIGRFGNWVVIANEVEKWVLMHFRHLFVSAGQVVRPGDPVGKTGRTGFDTVSGRILNDHTHAERHLNNNFIYSNDEAKNPLAAAALPRASTTISINVVRDSAMDPVSGTVDCHRLTITVDRGTYQNFHIDEFRAQGNLTFRLLRWSDRTGLNPADHDANNYDGVWFAPVAFNQASNQYVLVLYFSKAVIGSTWVAGHVKDTEGSTLWSG
jgi:hypothetical protein